MNLYYTGKDGNARKFAEEMERSGTADRIRREAGNEKYDYFFPMNDPERYISDNEGIPNSDSKFIKK